ncbi:MAG: hypothetical protein ISR77_31050 [Pirellulaceae bacterium]|nr:hypothetical protein [Pirellulaceae bacterium]
MPDQRETLLIVEDDPYDTKLTKRAIKKARILNPVQTVEDGEAAIAYLAGKPPYDDRSQYPLPVLVLLDLKLPEEGWIRGPALAAPAADAAAIALRAEVGVPSHAGAFLLGAEVAPTHAAKRNLPTCSGHIDRRKVRANGYRDQTCRKSSRFDAG